MGFWKNLKLFGRTLKFWDTQTVIETTIETTENLFREAKILHPDRDCHAWLASAFGGRTGYKVAPFAMFTQTTLFSVLENDAPIALAYFLLSQEMPAAATKFQERFGNVLQPALDLASQNKFFERWEQLNPWTATNVPGIREIVEEASQSLAQSPSGRLNDHSNVRSKVNK
jgi:hypothetical protein